MSGHLPVSPTYNITKSNNRQASDKEPATEIKSTAVLPYIKGLSELTSHFVVAYNSSAT